MRFTVYRRSSTCFLFRNYLTSMRYDFHIGVSPFLPEASCVSEDSPHFVPERTSLEFRSSLAWAPWHVEWNFECRLGEWSTSRRGNLGWALRRACRDRWFRNRGSREIIIGWFRLQGMKEFGAGSWRFNKRPLNKQGMYRWWQMWKDQKRKRKGCGKVDLSCCKSFNSLSTMCIVKFVTARPSNCVQCHTCSPVVWKKTWFRFVYRYRLPRHIAPS